MLTVPSIVCGREDYVVREGEAVEVCAVVSNPSVVFLSPSNITATILDEDDYFGLGTCVCIRGG